MKRLLLERFFVYEFYSSPPITVFLLAGYIGTTLYIFFDDNICDHFLNHNHPPDVQKLSRQAVNNVCKRKAVDDICERPSKIMNREVSNSVYKESLTTRDLELIRHNTTEIG
jgi:hypothetical protein